MLATRAGEAPRRLRPTARLVLVLALVGTALMAAASAGGFSAVQASTHNAVHVLKKLAISSPTARTVVSSPATDQYKKKCGSAPKKKCEISISDVTKLEGTGRGCTHFVFTVTLNQQSDEPVTVQYTTQDGSATAPSDYRTQTGTITFAPGETSKTIDICVIPDSAKEGDETFFVKLFFSAPSPNATIVDDTGVGTIQNDDKK